MGKRSFRELNLAIFKLHFDWLLMQTRARNVGIAYGNVKVVIIVLVVERLGLRWNFDLEDANELIAYNEMVIRLAGDRNHRLRKAG